MDLQISYLAANDTPTTPSTLTLPTPTNSSTDTKNSSINATCQCDCGGELGMYRITLWIIVLTLTIISTAIAV